MARKKSKPRRLLSMASVEHVRPTAPREPARPASLPPSLLPQTQEATPDALTALIASSSRPSSTHQELRLPANPSSLDLLALSSAVISQCGPQEATQRSSAAPPPPDAAPVQWPAEFNSSQGQDLAIWILCASFARLTAAAGLGDEDAVKALERSVPLQPSTIKRMQRVAKKRKERAALRREDVSKNMRSLEEIFPAVKGRVREKGGSTESDDGSTSCGGEVSGGAGGDGCDGGGGGDAWDDVARVKRAWIRLALALWAIFVVLVAWVVRSWFRI